MLNGIKMNKKTDQIWKKKRYFKRKVKNDYIAVLTSNNIVSNSSTREVNCHETGASFAHFILNSSKSSSVQGESLNYMMFLEAQKIIPVAL